MFYRVGALRRASGRALCVIGVCALASAAPSAHAQERLPGVLPVRADLATATLSPTSIYLRSAEIDTTQTAAVTRTPSRVLRPVAGKYYLIQLDGPITPERREALANAGINLGEYMQVNAFMASVNPDALQRNGLAGLNFVRFATEYRPEFKIDPDIGRRPFQSPERLAEQLAGRQSLTLTLHQGEALEPVLNSIAALPNSVVHFAEEIAGNLTVSISVSGADIDKLASLDAVQFIEAAVENTQRSNYGDRWILQSNITGVFPLYANGIRGEGQILGHVDGRINQTHCSFRDTNPIGPTHRKILNYNPTAGYDQHGTHTAGTAVGYDPASADTANVNGIATLSKLVHSLIPSQTETGITTVLNLHYGQGARVHTNSWGDDGTTAYTGQCRGIDAHVFSKEDSLVVFAVTNLSALKTPENAKNCFAVNRTNNTPSQDTICGTTAAGPTNDGRRKPEIMAPGCNTTSSSGSGATACGTASLTGTSMACPAIAGVSLLVREYFADGYYPTGVATPSNGFNPSAALVKSVLMNSAVDISGVAGFPSNQEGWGRALADNSLFFPSDARKLLAYDIRNPQGFTTGQQTDRTITVTAGLPFKATLVWSEPAAAANANPAYVNNLNLEVVDSGGNLYLGNVLTAGVSTTGGTADIRNNVEMVILPTPSAGQYTVRVKAPAVNAGGTQGYALVITGGVSDAPPPPPAPGPFALTSPANGASGESLTPTLTWATSSGADSYSVVIASDALLTNVIDGASGLAGTSYSVNPGILNHSGTYFWGVTASNVTGTTASTPAIFSFTTVPPLCPADFNGDGVFNTADLTILLQSFGQSVAPGTKGDLTGDGVVDTNDLTAFLTVFGLNCV